MAADQGLYELGDVVYARETLLNDGGVPEVEPEGLLAAAGARGVVVQWGHVEADLKQEVYLVRFEDETGTLGPPIGVLPEELTQDEDEAKRLRAA